MPRNDADTTTVIEQPKPAPTVTVTAPSESKSVQSTNPCHAADPPSYRTPGSNALGYTSTCTLISGQGGYNGIEPQVTITASSDLTIAYYGVQYTDSAGTIVGEDTTLVPSVPSVSAGQTAVIVPSGFATADPPASATGCELDPAESSITG